MAGQLTIDTLKASSGVLATQNGMTGIAKAWVNFAGANPATVNSSFNVSSVTYNSTGNYTVNFTTAMANANYALAGSATADGSNNSRQVVYQSNTTSSCGLIVIYSASTVTGTTGVTVVFMGS